MSSMTEEEREEFNKLVWNSNMGEYDTTLLYWDDFSTVEDYLNSRHLDYHGLIPKGLAIAVTPENNPYK